MSTRISCAPRRNRPRAGSPFWLSTILTSTRQAIASDKMLKACFGGVSRAYAMAIAYGMPVASVWSSQRRLAVHFFNSLGVTYELKAKYWFARTGHRSRRG